VCIDPHQTRVVGKGSDYLQLIKFWPSCSPRKVVCGGMKIFGSTLLQPACSVCISLIVTVINNTATGHNVLKLRFAKWKC